MVGLLVSHTFESVEFLDLSLLLSSVAMADSDIHTILQGTTVNAAHCNTTRIRAVIQRGDEKLRCTLQLFRSRNDLYNLIEQIVDVVGRSLPVFSHPAILGRAIDYREIELFLSSVEVAHQVEHHLVNFLRTAVRLIHLINYNDRLQTQLQSLLQHKTSLRHRTLESVDKKQTAVRHIEYTLYLATKIRVTRGIEDIDFSTFPINRHIL